MSSIADLQNELHTKQDEVKKLLRELSEREKEITELRNKVALLNVGIERMQDKPRKNRGLGISAEPISAMLKTSNDPRFPDFPKGLGTRTLLTEAIMDNYFMKHLEPSQIDQIVSAMSNKEYKKDSIIIREGDVGSHVFIIEDGVVEVSKSGEKLIDLKSGKAFGELAVLYNCTRQATAKATTHVSLWALSRLDYQTILTYSGLRSHHQCVKFLQSVPRIKDLPPENISKIADAVEEVHFHNGEYIIRQGAAGDTFYIITSGQVRVTKKETDSDKEKLVNMLKAGEYFGERALDSEEARQANVIADTENGVDCYVLERRTYKQLISIGYPTTEGLPRASADKAEDAIYGSVALKDLVTVATLGIGGFGRVELVHLHEDKSKTFALKKMKKKFIVDMQQQEHVMQEKSLLSEMRCHFIVRLYKTYKDAKYLYLLMEPCLGGELWTIMRQRRNFSEQEARFYVACVVEAYAYIHSRAIIYRDLKPENMMLDSYGYAKLVDFGFAKRIGHAGAKTWTFCGTPEYVAPEVILNKGHDFSADLWSLGILVYELINGSPPFNGNDHMNTYNMILRGIESVEFSKKIGRQAKSLIKKLCRDHPTDRIGYGAKGLKNLQKHKWFDSFNWDGLVHKTLKAPIIPTVKSPLDSTNFDKFPPDDGSDAAADMSGWDKDF